MSKTLSKIKPTLISDTKSFTLVELLIVVGLIAVLSVAIILAINPAELIKQARDSQRLSDLTNLSKAISLYEADTGGQGFMGTSSVVYISIPDTTSTCANLGLPQLPPSWSYRCVSSSTLQNIDGTGWIPINFNNLSFGKTLPKLPIDPINTTSSGNYYTYVSGGSFKLSSRLESQKYTLAYIAQDGGSNPALYEIGTNLSLAPFIGGLVGYWSFDEASGTIAYDYSGYNNNGTLYNGPVWTTGKVGSALSFDGVDDYMQTSNSIDLSNKSFTAIAWVYRISSQGDQGIISQNAGGNNKYLHCNIRSQKPYFGFYYNDLSGNTTVQTNIWYMIAFVYDYEKNIRRIYLNNVIDAQDNPSSAYQGSSLIKVGVYASSYLNGFIDEVRIYNRALTNQEIKAIYEATK
jgi:type II secretory pathway pseudopilin PulG